MDKDIEFIVAKMRECNDLKKKNRELDAENRWLKKVLKLAIEDRVIVVRDDVLNRMSDPVFDLDENLNNELIIRVTRKLVE